MTAVHQFYDALFRPLVEAHGELDRETLTSVVGFDAGGPASLCTIGYTRPGPTLFVTCELGVREDQVPASGVDRYELLAVTPDEEWARSILTDIGRMTLEVGFGNLDTLDIGPWVEEDAVIQGILFTVEYTVVINGEQCGILRCSGLTRRQLQHAVEDVGAVAGEIGVLGQQ